MGAGLVAAASSEARGGVAAAVSVFVVDNISRSRTAIRALLKIVNDRTTCTKHLRKHHYLLPVTEYCL